MELHSVAKGTPIHPCTHLRRVLCDLDLISRKRIHAT